MKSRDKSNQRALSEHTFAWDRMRLRLPSGWLLDRIGKGGPEGKSGLMAEFVDENGELRMLLRWNDARGGLDFANQIELIIRALGKKEEGPVGIEFDKRWRRIVGHDGRISRAERAAWKISRDGRIEVNLDAHVPIHGGGKGLAHMDYVSFRTRPSGGTGIVAYCKECDRAYLLDVYEQNERRAADVISRFRDHGGEDGEFIEWSAFGLRLRADRNLKHSSHAYDPRGLFRLELAGEVSRLTAVRWSAGRALLARSSLVEFARTVVKGKIFGGKLRRPTFDDSAYRGHEAVSFTEQSPIGRVVARSLFRMGPGRVARGILWHCEKTDRIFACTVRPDRAGIPPEWEIACCGTE